MTERAQNVEDIIEDVKVIRSAFRCMSKTQEKVVQERYGIQLSDESGSDVDVTDESECSDM